MSLSLKHLTIFFRFSVRFFSLGGFLVREFLHFEVHQDVAAFVSRVVNSGIVWSSIVSGAGL
jgi:hypothetical protein